MRSPEQRAIAASKLPVDPSRFTIPGKVSNGGLVPVEKDVASFFEVRAENPFEGLRNTRIVRVIFDNPVTFLSQCPKFVLPAGVDDAVPARLG